MKPKVSTSQKLREEVCSNKAVLCSCPDPQCLTRGWYLGSFGVDPMNRITERELYAVASALDPLSVVMATQKK